MCSVDVAGNVELSFLQTWVPDQARRNEIVTRTGVNEGDALDRLNVQLRVHHGRGGQDEGLVGTLGHGKDEFVEVGVESGKRLGA